MSWHRVGPALLEALGVAPVDPDRPADGGGATRVNADDPQAVPLYRRYYRCPAISIATGSRRRGCGKLYSGLSFRPQYDDDEPEARLCDACLDQYERRGERAQEREPVLL